MAGVDGASVGEGLGEPTSDGDDEADGLTDGDVGEAEGEGVAAAVQPARRTSDAATTASPAVTVCQRIASRLRDACTPTIARRSRG